MFLFESSLLRLYFVHSFVSKLMRFESAYTEDELIFDIPSNEEDSVEATTTTSNDATNGDELDWLKNL